MTPEKLSTLLEAFCQARVAPRATVTDLRPADGHAGLTYLVSVDNGTEDPTPKNYVLRLAPPGVKRRGNTDVYRQAPLLNALHSAGLPVPAVPFAEAGEEWLGTPFILMEQLPGRTFFHWDPHADFGDDPQEIGALWRAAVALLPQFHMVEWQRDLPANWETPRTLKADVGYWRAIYAKAPERAWAEAAERVEHLLLAQLPSGEPVGLFHGDYQPGNILYEQGRITGVIDWELTGIGAQLIDLGWLMMLADRQGWHESYRPKMPISAAEMVAIYEEGRGRKVPDATWYQAFAQFKLGSIACLNVKLHRKGQRTDPVWERFAPSIPLFFARAEALLTKDAR